MASEDKKSEAPKLSDEDKELARKVIKFADNGKITLDMDQVLTGIKVAKEAQRQGVNPDFVLPVFMSESQLRQDAVSPAGAIGVAQLLPSTAKAKKCDPHDKDANIQCGVSLIKELMDDPRVADHPYKVMIAYNTSTSTRNQILDAENPDLSVLPQETRDYMERASAIYGGTLPSATYTPIDTKSEAQTSESVEAPADEGKLQNIATTDDTQSADLPAQHQDVSRMGAGAAGAGLGATYGTGVAKSKLAFDTAERAIQSAPQVFNDLRRGKSPMDVFKDFMAAKAAATPQATTITPSPDVDVTPQSSGEKWGKNWGGFEAKPGSSVPEASNQWNRMMPSGVVTKRLAKKFGPTFNLAGQNIPPAPTEAELIAQGQAMREARYQDYLQNKAPANAPAKPVSPLGQVASKAGEYLQYGKYPLLGAAHGFNLFQGAADINNRIAKGQYGKAGLSAAGTVAGSAALHAPSIYATPLGAVAGAIPAYLYAAEHPSARPENIWNEIKEKGGTPTVLDLLTMPAYMGAKMQRGE